MIALLKVAMVELGPCGEGGGGSPTARRHTGAYQCVAWMTSRSSAKWHALGWTDFGHGCNGGSVVVQIS